MLIHPKAPVIVPVRMPKNASVLPLPGLPAPKQQHPKMFPLPDPVQMPWPGPINPVPGEFLHLVYNLDFLSIQNPRLEVLDRLHCADGEVYLWGAKAGAGEEDLLVFEGEGGRGAAG